MTTPKKRTPIRRKSAAKKPRKNPVKKRAKKTTNIIKRSLIFFMLVGTLSLGAYTLYLDHIVTEKFEGKRWSIPSRVYARALELYPDKQITTQQLLRELKLIGYRSSFDGRTAGTFLQQGESVTLSTRRFQHWDSEEPAQTIKLSIKNNKIQTLQDMLTGAAIPLTRLEPMQIGTIYPTHKEDRVLVQLEQLPEYLIKALMAIEDRHFNSHYGVDFKGIGRALLANIKAGGVVQGGSTLTQQLVKNFYLSNERTITRKINEAIMAMLLEFHYDKAEILEAYANEIYLGQDGARAIHGFGLAAEFYFNKPATELSLPESALLVAILRGPAFYDPRRYAERALKRRNHILDTMLRDELINQQQAASAKASPLTLSPKPSHGSGRYPAFVELVKRQLQKDYKEDDLRSEGLRIFTSLDPIAQQVAEQSLTKWTARLEKDYKIKHPLNGGIVISRPGSGEITAVVGDRAARFDGFNRALDTQRPVGSLLKPALYLTAIQQGYSLASMIEDAEVNITEHNGQIWSPQNYDHINHGKVTLLEALSHSYNLAAVNLGMNIGLGHTVQTLQALGIERPLPAYPSLLLGAVEMAPIDIAQMYQTLADEGFYTPLRAVREVLTQQNTPLQRYPMNTEQRFDHSQIQVINFGLEHAFRQGTGHQISQYAPTNLHLGGKTGTTDDLRDSWFAGFGDEHVAVVWLGADNNETIGLTGASGALRVWTDIMSQLATPRSTTAHKNSNIAWRDIDLNTGLLGGNGCANSVSLPLIKNTGPDEYAPCAQGILGGHRGGIWTKFKGLFQ